MKNLVATYMPEFESGVHQRHREAASRPATPGDVKLLTADADERAFLALTQFSLEHASEGIFWLRPDASLAYVNKKACEMLGYEREQLLSLALWEICPGFARHAWSELWLRIQTLESASVECTHIGASGEKLPVQIIFRYHESNGVAHAVAFVRDISEQRLLAQQLIQAQKMEAVGRLAGGVAHDFNNLLSVILSFSDMILEEIAYSDPLRADVSEIRNAAQRAADVARQLLVFSRRDAAKSELLDLNGVVRNMEKLLRRLIGEDVQLETRLGEELHVVQIDPGEADQVLANLAVNSRDAMPNGGTLLIETANVCVELDDEPPNAELRPGFYVKLTVSDTGVGMTADVAKNAMDPFFTTKPKSHGTGLGLSIVYDIVKKAGGVMSFESKVGQGTTFDIYLPARGKPSRSVHSTLPPNELCGKGQTILVVEDEDAVRVLAARVLGRHGYRVLQGRNAGEAILICEQLHQPIDLVLTDVVMPQLSGKELAARLSSLRPGLKICYMTGYPNLADEGRSPVLFKPFTKRSLLSLVGRALDAR